MGLPSFEQDIVTLRFSVEKISSGQSYKASTIVIYDSRVLPDLKIPHIMTLDS